ncbi:tagaturonate reductase [Anditalea andensis]|uniref:Altronate oxidoreductase n=1 Tax=Anditalea andensis TaxID=1048983 RepID=A0A074LFU2_9BACT|nr:tagaturonate reductase [Anditalea andensis]KEO72632.1 altronate oxidoreductase [Anditalea andensis]
MKTLKRNALTIAERPIKVIQFGEGNFLRGFVDWIIDVMNEKTSFNGNVHIVQPLATGLADMIENQDGLYHVLLEGIHRGKTIQESRLITSVEGASNPFEDYSNYLSLADNKDLKFIISNTTEAGIAYDPEDKAHTILPVTFPGKLTALLYQRFKTFEGQKDAGLVIIPCELIEKNGEQLESCVLQYAKLWDLPAAFSSWIKDANSFCNTLVDRIVPGFPKDTIKEIQQNLGFEDQLVVMAEPFHLWVIEGPENLKGIFPAEEAGLEVKFVKDLSPYRTRKVRILNGAHTALVPVAYLAGLRTVREAVEDPHIGKYINETIFSEIIPTLDLSEDELKQFAIDVLDRFKNPFIRHELASIALNSISKFKVRVLPSLLAYKQVKGTWPDRLTYSLANLIMFYNPTIGCPINDDEAYCEFFSHLWNSENILDTVYKTLSNITFWGEDLTLHAGLTEKVTEQLNLVASQKQQC